MQALKTTNARLTTALQESMTNVDQWHRQLSIYKDENENLKKQVHTFHALLISVNFNVLFRVVMWVTM